MTRPASYLAFLLPLGFLFAGCLEDGGDYHAAGEKGSFALGWAYDGKGVIPFDGFITIHADPVTNTGDAIVEGELRSGADAKHWRILFDHYAEQSGRAFQDGGIAQTLDEHGDTKIGDASIPKVRVDTAAWGDALVTVDDQPVPDPLTGEARWVAHYMVILTGVRDDQTGAIETTAGGVYDPDMPADGAATEGDHEIHLVLKSHATAPPNATAISNQSQPGTLPTGVTGRHAYANKYANSELNLTVKIEGTFVGGQTVNFTLRDPNGAFVKSVLLNNNQREAPFVVQLPIVGKYDMRVTGQGVQASYEITGELTPPSNVVMNFWWEDIIFGQAAEAFEATAATHTHADDNDTAPKRF